MKLFVNFYAPFLPIDHTPGDTDPFFSCTSRRLKEINAVTLVAPHKELRETYNDLTTVAAPANDANISRFFENTSRVSHKTPLFSAYCYLHFPKSERKTP